MRDCTCANVYVLKQHRKRAQTFDLPYLWEWITTDVIKFLADLLRIASSPLQLLPLRRVKFICAMFFAKVGEDMREHKSPRTSLPSGYYLGHDAFMCRREIYRKDANIDKAIKPQECQRRFDKNFKTLKRRLTTATTQQSCFVNNARWLIAFHVFSESKLASMNTQYEYFRKHLAKLASITEFVLASNQTQKMKIFANKKNLLSDCEMNHRKQKRKLICYLPFSFESKVFKNNSNLPKVYKNNSKSELGSSRWLSLTNWRVSRFSNSIIFSTRPVWCHFCIARADRRVITSF